MLTEHTDRSITLSEARTLLCLDVAWELEALALALPGVVPMTDDLSRTHLVVRGIAGRIAQLSGVLMSAVGDEQEQTIRLLKTVRLTK